ncbi:hypothetical protein PF008_g32135 [Phytophthora fragariae]|uniref:Uncharacterized protein n=2 Tax=Phytophthora fragariae TaxID=53985 RepID=A0A6G0Q0M9_9STRA|nr:hypothetical protein PF008_g32135 [Phytophthora fragariae]
MVASAIAVVAISVGPRLGCVSGAVFRAGQPLMSPWGCYSGRHCVHPSFPSHTCRQLHREPPSIVRHNAVTY